MPHTAQNRVPSPGKDVYDTVSNIKGDICKSGVTIQAIQKGDDITNKLGCSLEDINKIGKGQGLPFFIGKGHRLIFPADKKSARVNVEEFEMTNGKKGRTLVGRAYCDSYQDWEWFPIAMLRRLPATDYRQYLTVDEQTAVAAALAKLNPDDRTSYLEEKGLVLGSDGKMFTVINEELEFFKDYPLGREFARRNICDLELYTSLIGREFVCEDLKVLHKHDFGLVDGKVKRLETFSNIIVYKFKEITE